ncbi:hypothetical protein HOD30_03665 [Candidatus Peregrinibacteria bacterium]|jgi:hypothetical protein|nr:hypothetical protein [Candidatus Peregrinibacteria bacterium]MBT4632376.1 hypothetical protein [Candidatus Peregrinibacteria bacterium]MBT5517013.1 hypothetical protein [Candidatus Peregrinibacteria bacterium]MBT5823580.1 hypothetical protein [Candidatus Peregrinibacteria bacterium]
MKKNHIIGLLVLVIVVLGALLLSESDSEELQGRIVSRGIVDVEYELNPASPSGAHTVSASDEVFILDFSVDSETMVESGSIMGFSINAASANISEEAEGMLASIKSLGEVVGEGYVTVNSSSQAVVAIVASQDLVTDAFKTSTYTLVLDTGMLLDEAGGVDDPVVFTFKTRDGEEVVGNTLQY